MTCRRKHVFQVPDEHFNCPSCGSSVEQGIFYIDNDSGVEDTGCELLHADDELVCYKCRYVTTGAKFSKRIQKQLNMVKCSACKGVGYVEAS